MKYFLLSLVVFACSLDIAAEERTITTSDGVQLYVNVKGTGAPCLYLHGGPGSGSYWLEKFFGEFMESKYTMIYLDQRGVGRSGGAYNNDFSMETYGAGLRGCKKGFRIQFLVYYGALFWRDSANGIL